MSIVKLEHPMSLFKRVIVVQGALHMKILFPLFSRVTGKKILFPGVHIRNISPPGRDFFGGLLGGKMLREANIPNG